MSQQTNQDDQKKVIEKENRHAALHAEEMLAREVEVENATEYDDCTCFLCSGLMFKYQIEPALQAEITQEVLRHKTSLPRVPSTRQIAEFDAIHQRYGFKKRESTAGRLPA